MAPPPQVTALPNWAESVHIVQHIAESGIQDLPSQYVQPDSIKQSLKELCTEALPVIDLGGLADASRREQTLKEIAYACEEWGFFHILNHGVPDSLIKRMQTVCRQFFALPLEEKQPYANTQLHANNTLRNNQGYGSRVGVGQRSLDWGDYLYLLAMPTSMRDLSKWPNKPEQWRDTMEEYCKEMKALASRLLALMSCNLGLAPEALEDAFGGDKDFAQWIRINYYAPCPQPELALGLYKHADPGGITILWQDDDVEGLQVHRDGRWITVKPIPGSLIINIGDQAQVLCNGKYKSVQHRAIVNAKKDRMSLACFCNPGDDVVVGPLKELVNEENPARYTTQTYGDYRKMVANTLNKGSYTLTVQSLAVTKAEK